MAQTLSVTLNASNIGCNSYRTGSIHATVSGGVPPYHFRWSNDAPDAPFIYNLSIGYYECTVTDATGAEARDEITIIEPEPIRITQFSPTVYANGYNTSCFFCFDGGITLSVAGGVAPYTYVWSDGSTQQNRTGLAPKAYQVKVTDAYGCVFEDRLSVTLVAPERDDWTANGNSNVGANSFIGTTTNFDFVLKANNTEGMRVKTNGDAIMNYNLGIGTNTPTEKLEVSGGNARFGGNVTINGNLKIPSSNIPNPVLSCDINGTVSIKSFKTFMHDIKATVICESENSSGLISTLPDFYTIQDASTSNYKNILGTCSRVLIGDDISHSQYQNVVSLPQFSVIGNSIFNGRVGINKTPSCGLDVDDNITKFSYQGNEITFKPHNPGPEIGSSTGELTFWHSTAGYTNLKIGTINLVPINGASRIYSSSSATIFLDSDNNESNESFSICSNDSWYSASQLRTLFNLNSDGQAFITTTLPASDDTRAFSIYNTNQTSPNNPEVFRVSTKGKVWCYRLRVQTNNFPDYVFKKDYKLLGLNEVESFTRENSHLPNMPSEKELVEGGLDVSNLISKNTENIEQLYLYIFQLKKEIDSLKAENRKLQK